MLQNITKKNSFSVFFIFFEFLKNNFYFLSLANNFFFLLKYGLISKKIKSINFFFLKQNNFFILTENEEVTDYFNNSTLALKKKLNFNINSFQTSNCVKNFLFLNTSQKSFFLKKNFYYSLFNFFFLNSFLNVNSHFQRTGFFNFFFFKNSKGSPYLINLNKVLARWIDFFNLILNIFFFEINSLTYSSPFFKNETLALNWSFSNFWDLRSWKYSYPHFIFKTNFFSTKTSFFYEKIASWDFCFFFVSDCVYHYKNLYFFKKKFFYTVGLISLNINPWLVSYPVIASSNSYINQIFFLQSLVYAQKKSFFLQFLFFKKIWFFTKFLKLK